MCLGMEVIGFTGGGGLWGGMFGKTSVCPVGIGEGGVGGHGSMSAAEVWWARSWSSCSSLDVENGRSKRLSEVGVFALGIEKSEFSSWLDQNLNHVEVEGFLWEMVVSYDDGSYKTQVRPFVMVGLGRAKRSLSLIKRSKIHLK